MKVVILCGGKGTRLNEETEYRPKPMVQIGSQPILWHIMKVYARYGYQDFVLCLGYKGDMIREYFLNYETMHNDFTIRLGQKQEITYHDTHGEQDYRVTLADTGLETMTGARVKQIEKYIDGDTFMVTYGDGLSDLNIQKLLEFHHSHGRLATMSAVRPTSRFGNLRIGNDNRIIRFEEKPQLDDWVNAGFFVFERGVFDYLSTDASCVLEDVPLIKLANDKQLVAYRHEGYFFAMDTYREYLHLNEIWKQKRAPWKVW
jgi:glucose-1-phosphate cytidylyltransferase